MTDEQFSKLEKLLTQINSKIEEIRQGMVLVSTRSEPIPTFNDLDDVCEHLEKLTTAVKEIN